MGNTYKGLDISQGLVDFAIYFCGCYGRKLVIFFFLRITGFEES